MWFRPRSQQNDSDRFRVASIRNRMRSKKSISKCVDADTKESNGSVAKPVTATPIRARDSDVLRSQSGRRLSILSDEDDGTKEKSKALRGDQKYKKNRVTKSSSRTKVPDLIVEKTSSNKSIANSCSNSQRKVSTPFVDPASPVKTKTNRRNTTLNLNALLRYKSFISGSTKKLTPDDFDRLRRKSLGDTGKIRRKSNPDANKPSSDEQCDVEPSLSVDSDKSTDNDFHSCDEDQVDAMRLSPKYQSNAPSTKKTPRSKNKKKGFYLQIPLGIIQIVE